MRKDITIEKIIIGGEKVNKSELARQYDCCCRTIDRRLNPEKYKVINILKLKSHNFRCLWLFLIYLYYLIIGVDVSMWKDITIEKIMLVSEKLNKKWTS